MLLPTRRVKAATGIAVINVSDFDAAIHEPVEDEAVDGAGLDPAPSVAAAATLTAAELVTLIKGADVETLDTLQDAEAMRESGARKTVTAAIEARRAALAAA